MKRLLLSQLIALFLLLIPMEVLAAPGLVTSLSVVPSDTSLSLSWTPATASTLTVIRYSTTAYPANPAAGSAGYTGAGWFATISSLTAGLTYYICAWGYDGVNYSASPAQVITNTLAVSLPDGGAATPSGANFPVPVIPASADQAPNPAALDLRPFSTILDYFNSAPGGFGMPTIYAWETITMFLIVLIGVWVYVKVRTFEVAWFVVLALTYGAAQLTLTQSALIYGEIAIGLGVLAMQRATQ